MNKARREWILAHLDEIPAPGVHGEPRRAFAEKYGYSVKGARLVHLIRDAEGLRFEAKYGVTLPPASRRFRGAK